MTAKPKKRKINPMLMNVLLISLGAHLLVGFLLAGWVVVKYVVPNEAQFEEAPTIQEEAPPPDVKVEIKPQAAPQNQAMRNLRMQQVGNIAVANVDVDLPNMEESFTVSSGLGNVGGGSILSGASGTIGLGMSNVSVFGLKTRAERLLFVIDVSREMLTDKKGGLNSFKIIKNEITDMVGNLSTGTLFNVMLVDGKRSKLFKSQIVPSGTEVHQELIKWISPINSNVKSLGLETDRKARPTRTTALQKNEMSQHINTWSYRGNEVARNTQVALEQNVDAIFFITGYHRGFQEIRRISTDNEKKEWERITSSDRYKKQMAAYQAEVPKMQKRVTQKLASINKKRSAEGKPPRVLGERYGLMSQATQLNLKWTNKHPGFEPDRRIDKREVEKYFRELVQVLYEDRDAPNPSINVILFLAGDEDLKPEWEKRLKDYARFFRGKSRVIRGQNEIKEARSSENTTN